MLFLIAKVINPVSCAGSRALSVANNRRYFLGLTFLGAKEKHVSRRGIGYHTRLFPRATDSRRPFLSSAGVNGAVSPRHPRRGGLAGASLVPRSRYSLHSHGPDLRFNASRRARAHAITRARACHVRLGNTRCIMQILLHANFPGRVLLFFSSDVYLYCQSLLQNFLL